MLCKFLLRRFVSRPYLETQQKAGGETLTPELIEPTAQRSSSNQ